MTTKHPHPFALFAFHILESRLNGISPTQSLASFLTHSSTSTTSIGSSPLFVTWNILSKSGEKHLRGCIGTFSPLPLEQGIAEYSLIAALQDTRFGPITKRELSSLSCSITVLENFEDAKDALDWELGKHGVRVKIIKSGRSYGATFLPDVAVEQGWDKEETIEHCVRKGGFRGGYDLSEVKVIRYEGRKVGATYQEYVDVMKELDG